MFLFLISCKKADDVYCNFTDDDLGWIYFTQKTSDSQTYILKYLVNNADTLAVNVTSLIENPLSVPRISLTGLHSRYNEYFENGKAFYEYNDSSFIRHALIEIRKIKEGLYIRDINLNCSNYSYVSLCSEGNFIPQMIIDTATVNNKTYNEVYKFNPVNETIKVVYFAKTYGFIKIELNDGNKLELIANH